MDLTDPPTEPDLYPFQLRTVSTGEVLKEISLLRSNCSTGVDQTPVKYVKQFGDFLTGRLAHIINLCISNSQFPRIWKTACISTVRKVDNPKQNADYRPVSILLALSKVFQRLVLKQLVHSIDEQSFNYYSQASRASGKDSPPQLFCSVFGTILFGAWRGVRSPWWSWPTIRRHLIRFKSVFTKMHVMGFSKSFLHWNGCSTISVRVSYSFSLLLNFIRIFLSNHPFSNLICYGQ